MRRSHQTGGYCTTCRTARVRVRVYSRSRLCGYKHSVTMHGTVDQGASDSFRGVPFRGWHKVPRCIDDMGGARSLLALVVALSLGNTVHAFKATPRREALRCAATFASSAWVLPAFAKNKARARARAISIARTHTHVDNIAASCTRLIVLWLCAAHDGVGEGRGCCQGRD